MKLTPCVLLLLPVLLAALNAPAAGKTVFAYVGTYTGPNSQGIYVYHFNGATGELMDGVLAAKSSSPSYLAFHPSGKFLYAVNENDHGGAVSAFQVDAKTGKLQPLNSVSSKGGGPCHLSVDKTGKWVLVANYGSGSIASLPILPDGKLGEAVGFVQHKGSGGDKSRQEGPHAHWIDVSPDNRYVLAADLGLDEILVYRFDAAKGTLTPHGAGKTKPAAGPRHVAFHPNGHWVYCINELDSTVTAFHWDAAKGALQQFQNVSTLRAGFKGENYPAEIRIHPSGKFLYGSNRRGDDIAVFTIDPSKGTLTLVQNEAEGIKEPRGVNLDPSGNFLVVGSQNANTVVVFKVDPKTGKLTSTGKTVKVGAPVDVEFLTVQ